MRQREPDCWLRIVEPAYPEGVVRAAWIVSRGDGLVRVRAGTSMLVMTEAELAERERLADDEPGQSWASHYR